MVRAGIAERFTRTEGWQVMVQVTRRERTIYVLLEDERPIGQVVAPEGVPILAPGAGTVFLRREPDRASAAAA
jgi:hypothetical protein